MPCLEVCAIGICKLTDVIATFLSPPPISGPYHRPTSNMITIKMPLPALPIPMSIWVESPYETEMYNIVA